MKKAQKPKSIAEFVRAHPFRSAKEVVGLGRKQGLTFKEDYVHNIRSLDRAAAKKFVKETRKKLTAKLRIPEPEKTGDETFYVYDGGEKRMTVHFHNAGLEEDGLPLRLKVQQAIRELARLVCDHGEVEVIR